MSHGWYNCPRCGKHYHEAEGEDCPHDEMKRKPDFVDALTQEIATMPDDVALEGEDAAELVATGKRLLDNARASLIDGETPRKPCSHGIPAGEPCNDCVICPECVHQFRAIPVNVQRELSQQSANLSAALDALDFLLNAHPQYRDNEIVRAAIKGVRP